MNKNTCIISCPVSTFSGYGARSRDLVKALIQSKGEEWDIKILPQIWGNCPHGFIEANPEWSFLTPYIMKTPIQSQPDIWIQITVANEFQKVGKYNIGITAGLEIDLVPSDWIEGCNRMDLVLVSSEHSKTSLINSRFQKVNKQTNQVEGTFQVNTKVEVLFEGMDEEIYQQIEWID